MKTDTPLTIVSASRADLTQEQNDWRSLSLLRLLQQLQLDFAEVEGTYEGKQERAYLVLTPSGDDGGTAWEHIVSLARKFKQDSVVYIDANRYVSEYFLSDGRWVGKGMLTDTTPDSQENKFCTGGRCFAAGGCA